MLYTKVFLRAVRAPPLLSTRIATTIKPRFASNSSAQKDAQLDRTKMDTQPNEYSKSGTDDVAAEQEHAAFNPKSSNDPEEAMKEAGQGTDNNPLNVSPADPEVSTGTSEISPGADKKQSEGGGGRQGGGDNTGNKSGGSSV